MESQKTGLILLSLGGQFFAYKCIMHNGLEKMTFFQKSQHLSFWSIVHTELYYMKLLLWQNNSPIPLNLSQSIYVKCAMINSALSDGYFENNCFAYSLAHIFVQYILICLIKLLKDKTKISRFSGFAVCGWNGSMDDWVRIPAEPWGSARMCHSSKWPQRMYFRLPRWHRSLSSWFWGDREKSWWGGNQPPWEDEG